MLANSLSPCITTTKVEESRDFYVKHFGAKITFDCGWYVNLEFGKGAALQFMAPQPDQPACNPVGLTYNFSVSDVDAEFQVLTGAGLAPIMPLEDHPALLRFVWARGPVPLVPPGPKSGLTAEVAT